MHFYIIDTNSHSMTASCKMTLLVHTLNCEGAVTLSNRVYRHSRLHLVITSFLAHEVPHMNGKAVPYQTQDLLRPRWLIQLPVSVLVDGLELRLFKLWF
jgi:hypothetical protein